MKQVGVREALTSATPGHAWIKKEIRGQKIVCRLELSMMVPGKVP